MNAATRRFVRSRAADRCEYCGLRQHESPVAQLQIEHVIAKKHGGDDSPENLALACIDCNLAKASNLSGIDPITAQIVTLFHPRQQRWDDHFELQGALILGKTSTGRATVNVLNFNFDERVDLRSLRATSP